MVGASTITSAKSDYDVVKASGQTIRVGQGDTYENKLIDLTTGGDFLIYVTGGDCTIRNIGFKGLYRGGGFQISIKATSGTVTVENVYLGDGATKAGADFVHGPGAVFYHKDANCDMRFNRVHVQGYTNNAFYCSNTATGGSVHFKNCFGKNNGVTTFRCASGDDVIENCVAYNDSTDYGGSYDNGWVVSNGRPVWVWNGGEVQIKDCEFAAGTYSYAMVAGANGSPGRAHIEGGAIDGQIQEASGSTVTTSNVGSNPSLEPPEGVPMTPEEAASGTGSGGSGDWGGGTEGYTGEVHSGNTLAENENALVFSGTHLSGDDVQQSQYTLGVSESLVPSRRSNATVDDSLDFAEGDTSYQGTVTDWKDAWVFTGEITDLSVDGPAKVFLNGDEIDPSNYGKKDKNSDDSQDDSQNGSDGQDDSSTGKDGQDSQDGQDGTEQPGGSPTDDTGNDGNSDQSDNAPSEDDETEITEEDVEQLLKAIFGDGGLLDRLFGSGGMFN